MDWIAAMDNNLFYNTVLGSQLANHVGSFPGVREAFGVCGRRVQKSSARDRTEMTYHWFLL